MATKESNTTMMNKTEDTIKRVSAKVHEELLNTSHLFIDETVATLTRMQKITGKMIKKSEPIVEKQIEMTFDTVEALKAQAEKGGKRALKLLGLTKQYNKLSETIAEKVKEIPSTEEMIENAKDIVATAKSDVEETINKASDSLKSVTNFGETEVAKKAEKKIVSTTKNAKTVTKKVVKKAKTTAKKSSRTISSTKKAPPVAKNAIVPVKKVSTTVQKATATAVKSQLTQIKGIGPSLANIMADNGIKTIKDLKEATPTALKIIATKAGNRYKSFDTKKWIAAAKAIK